MPGKALDYLVSGHKAPGPLSPSTTIRELASLAILDIAQAGWGDQAGNVHKAIVRLADPTRFKVKCPDKRRQRFSATLDFCQLGKALPRVFHEKTMVENLEKFWKAVEKTRDEKLKHHCILCSLSALEHWEVP